MQRRCNTTQPKLLTTARVLKAGLAVKSLIFLPQMERGSLATSTTLSHQLLGFLVAALGVGCKYLLVAVL